MVMPNPSAVDFRTQRQIEFDKFAEEQAKDNLGLDTKAARDAIAAKREGEDARELAEYIAIARNEREKRERLIDDKVADSNALVARDRASRVAARGASGRSADEFSGRDADGVGRSADGFSGANVAGVSARNSEFGPEGPVNPGPGYTDEGMTAFDGPGGSGAAYESTAKTSLSTDGSRLSNEGRNSGEVNDRKVELDENLASNSAPVKGGWKGSR